LLGGRSLSNQREVRNQFAPTAEIARRSGHPAAALPRMLIKSRRLMLSMGITPRCFSGRL
jgi:hypothetical protein